MKPSLINLVTLWNYLNKTKILDKTKLQLSLAVVSTESDQASVLAADSALLLVPT